MWSLSRDFVVSPHSENIRGGARRRLRPVSPRATSSSLDEENTALLLENWQQWVCRFVLFSTRIR
jgi:hypothetical protein